MSKPEDEKLQGVNLAINKKLLREFRIILAIKSKEKGARITRVDWIRTAIKRYVDRNRHLLPKE